MTETTIDRADWALSFRKLVANLSARQLRPQKGKPSDKQDCASFELEPQLHFDDVYLECRFEVLSKEANTEGLDKNAARIIVVLPVDQKANTSEVCEFVRPLLPEGLEVRVSKSGRRIYICRPGLPLLDMSQHVSKQVGEIKEYAEASLTLQTLWQELSKAIKNRTSKPAQPVA